MSFVLKLRSQALVPLVVLAAAMLAPAEALAHPTAAPCTRQGEKSYCSFYTAGNGHSAGTPVVDATGHWIGYLNQGTNWVTCELRGGEVANGAAHNDFWGWTEADDGRWGWVNAVWASGGSNDGALAHTPGCYGQHGAAPPGQLSSGPTAPTPAPAPTRPNPNSCSDLRQNQSANVAFPVRVMEYEEYGSPDEGQAPTRHYLVGPRTKNYGLVHIGAATCRSPHGWHVVSPIQLSYGSAGLYTDAEGELEPRGGKYLSGWGVAARSIRGGVIRVHTTYCTDDRRELDGLNILGAIPVPYASYAVSLLQWGLTSFVHLHSGSRECADMGYEALRVASTRTGALHVTDAASHTGGINTDRQLSDAPVTWEFNQRNPQQPRISYGA